MGPFWVYVGPFLGPSWAILGVILDHLWFILGHIGGIVGASWASKIVILHGRWCTNHPPYTLYLILLILLISPSTYLLICFLTTLILSASSGHATTLSHLSALPVPMLRQVYLKWCFCVGGGAKMAILGFSWGHLRPSWAMLGHLGSS